MCQILIWFWYHFRLQFNHVGTEEKEISLPIFFAPHSVIFNWPNSDCSVCFQFDLKESRWRICLKKLIRICLKYAFKRKSQIFFSMSKYLACKFGVRIVVCPIHCSLIVHRTWNRWMAFYFFFTDGHEMALHANINEKIWTLAILN